MQVKAVRLAIMMFMPFVAVWLIREVHSIVLQSGDCTEHHIELWWVKVTDTTVTTLA